MAVLHHTHATKPPQGRRPAENNAIHEPTLWKVIILAALTYLVWSDRIAIVFNAGSALSAAPVSQEFIESREPAGTTASFFSDLNPSAPSTKTKKRQAPREVTVELPRSALNNATFAIDPQFAQRNAIETGEVSKRMERCRDYAERFAPVAQAEMRKFGIPASITLAQGLLESNAGVSPLATKTNNHFGMKCFSKRCKTGHCINFSDDSHKDFFVKYANVWGSYRAHSQMLKGNRRYAGLFELSPTDYRGWARGLAESGYASDKQYGDKLIALIQHMGLDRYDRD